MKRSIHQHELSYLFLRAALGVNLLAHGLVRLIDSYGRFVRNTGKAFEDTFIPDFVVKVFAASLPPAETVIGTFILLGFHTRFALSAGAAVMILLIFGKCLQQDWTTVSLQMIYMLFYYILLDRLGDNRISLDGRKKRVFDIEE